MIRRLLIAATLLNLCGCATVKELGSGLLHRPVMGKKLGDALQELEKGNERAAAATLEALLNEPPVADISDEALFRLALLRLGNGEGSQAPQLLERLQKEYPDSIWARQSQPLLHHLKSVEELKVQNRNLKILNLSLSRENKELLGLKSANQSLLKENKELRQSIERLKSLDIELEKKSR